MFTVQDLFDEVINRYEMGENKLPFPKELIQESFLASKSVSSVLFSQR